MPTNVKVLSSRKAYEYGPDEIRLTVLGSPTIRQALQVAFTFDVAEVAHPQETFGEVPLTSPPGVVCHGGHFTSADNEIVPIRALLFEPRRVVVDVAAPSSTLDAVFEQVKAVLAKYSAPGAPLLGIPSRERHQSELTFTFEHSFARLFHPAVLPLFERASDCGEGDVLFPRVHFVVGEKGVAYPGDGRGIASVTLSPRLGTTLEDRVYFSTAMLDSDAHLDYLTRLDAALR